MRSFWSLVSITIFCATAYGDVAIEVDVLDDPGEGTLPPPLVAVVDVLVDVSADDAWSAGGFRGLAVNGARLRYATDPNSGVPALFSPGAANRFVTFVSRPRPRDADSRFNTSGAAIAGRYCPTGPEPVANPTVINVAYFANPPVTAGSPSVDGAVIRLAIDAPVPGPYVVRRLDEVEPGDLLLFISDCDGGAVGTAAATYDVPAVTGFDWALVRPIPEPATGALAATAIFGLARRRRRE